MSVGILTMESSAQKPLAFVSSASMARINMGQSRSVWWPQLPSLKEDEHFEPSEYVSLGRVSGCSQPPFLRIHFTAASEMLKKPPKHLLITTFRVLGVVVLLSFIVCRGVLMLLPFW